MSRAYRIQVSEKVTRVIHVKDGVCSKLDILPVLAPERLAAILAAELRKRGFEGTGSELSRRSANGVVVAVDTATGDYSVRVDKEQEVEGKGEEETVVQEEERRAKESTTRAALRKKAKVEAEEDAAAQAKRLQRGATADLESSVGEIRAELDAAVGRATVTALKERAAQLGNIVRVSEEGDSLTIEVKV